MKIRGIFFVTHPQPPLARAMAFVQRGLCFDGGVEHGEKKVERVTEPAKLRPIEVERSETESGTDGCENYKGVRPKNFKLNFHSFDKEPQKRSARFRGLET